MLSINNTRINQALKAGNLRLANKLLKKSYSISGLVSHGDKIGRTIGFPTTNIHIFKYRALLKGVFVIELFGVKNRPIKGVANMGIRPTVGGRKAILEAHLFNFNSEIYGRYVRVIFLHKLRNEQNFTNVQRLREQINKDCRQAHTFFT